MLIITLCVVLYVSSCVQVSSAARNDTDQITNLPGLTYGINFKQYSGYLQASPGHYMHYWLVESQSSTPSSDPLILWLNGGPGCSSLKGLLNELGPFHPNPDGTTLFENVFSWNKKANILFLESPINTGFSFQNVSQNNDTTYDDDRTAWDNFLAVKDFFANYPEYVTRDFYIMGVSYGGVYVPTLTNLLIKQIQAKNLTANLVGIAMGNGQLSINQIINSNIVYLYAHGIIEKDDFDSLLPCCPNNTLVDCDFASYLTLNTHGVPFPINATSECAKKVAEFAVYRVWITINNNNIYNIYEDCYQQPGSAGSNSAQSPSIGFNSDGGFVDQGSLFNWASTDAFGGFSCYAGSAAEKYLNSITVRNALHILSNAPSWQTCNDAISQVYVRQYLDTTSVFDHIIASGHKLRILVYNGDVDTACGFLAAEWFVEALKRKYGMNITSARQPWLYRQTSQSSPQLAGYQKSFTYQNITIDLVTVKGAGHYVPTDRPGPALQMITNFINNVNYSTPTGFSITRAPLLPQYQPGPAKGSGILVQYSAILLFVLLSIACCIAN